MTDLVERLRALDGNSDMPTILARVNDAADVIARLRAPASEEEVELIGDVLGPWIPNDPANYEATVAALSAFLKGRKDKN